MDVKESETPISINNAIAYMKTIEHSNKLFSCRSDFYHDKKGNTWYVLRVFSGGFLLDTHHSCESANKFIEEQGGGDGC